MGKERKLKILVSSVVHGYVDMLESIYSLLEEFGYEVLMSYKGTVPIDPEISAMTSCVEAVEECDLFLGIILPRYGSGKEEGKPHSITHRECIRAIELNKPRWFLAHENVDIAWQLLKPYRDTDLEPKFQLKSGMMFERTPILDDLRILELYELAMNLDTPQVRDRKANWVQPYGVDDDARLFATAQFRRHRELMEKHLSKLEDSEAIRKRIKGGQS